MQVHRASAFVATGVIVFTAFAVTARPAPAAEESEDAQARGRDIIRRAVRAHGHDKLAEATVQFRFRGTPYRMSRRGGRYRFERTVRRNGRVLAEVLTNDGYAPTLDGQPLSLPAPQRDARRRSLNSVVYFASIPFVLEDPAVRPRAGEPMTIKGRIYDTVEVRFTADGGGDDHDDVFLYWFDRETARLDYLAYSFRTGEGGVRLRVATDHTEVGGMTFIQWENYGLPDRRIPLDTLPARWLESRLPRLSAIRLDALTRVPRDSD